jgi:murein hydrolase activator
MTLLLSLLGSDAGNAAATSALQSRHADSRGEFERLTREITLSEEKLKSLAAEIAGIRKDHATVTAALIQAAKTEKKLSQDVEDISARLDDLQLQEDGVRASLRSRRGVLAEVLAALQRMGLNPPPALLVRPEDALSSIRSAILLGSVVPELRSETELLLSDLKELSRVSASIAGERDRLLAAIAEQATGQQRLAMLLEEKKRLQSESEANLAAERKRAADLASRAGSLKDLIASLEGEMDKQRRVEEAERRAAEKRLARQEKQRIEAEQAQRRPAPPINQLALSAPFESLQGALALPVSGRIARRFGDSDGSGGQAFGDTVKTQSGAIVTAPSDGTVLYAGPFRNYGHILILNAGDGYHVVLVGMSKINVQEKQPVLAGEPVGAMGDTRVASALTIGSADTQPELYIEFRKDGKPVDPAAWWPKTIAGRTGNGS